ncbi:MAG: glucose-1-phosphate adenylyltransferase [Bifidobacteriaceae bacterium]|nr:glucose-1-phosphate adenylyltransferase [Bifidobacteriaceae bacterium]
MDKNKVLCFVLAGGEGKRLQPLTSERAKPAVHFGGTHRLIDFALSNLVNSGFNKIAVLTQYKSQSLNLHIARNWQMNARFGNFIMVVPPQQRYSKDWYLGSADAIYQCQNVIEDNDPEYIIIVGADHVYRMDFSQMLQEHLNNQADITVAAIRQPIELASEFGVIDVDRERPEKIHQFLEKPQSPQGLPYAQHEVLASMGNYIASARALNESILLDHDNPQSKHDMGGDIVPHFTNRGTSFVYDFKKNLIPGEPDLDQNYWRDVGSLDAFYDANMDLVAVVPKFNMYNKQWPIHTNYTGLPPAKFVFNEEQRIGYAKNSLVGPGSIISGAKVNDSIISTEVRIGSYSEIINSIVFPNVNIERSVRLNKVIVDRYAFLPAKIEIGFDRAADLERGFTVTDSGITVVPRFWGNS